MLAQGHFASVFHGNLPKDRALQRHQNAFVITTIRVETAASGKRISTGTECEFQNFEYWTASGLVTYGGLGRCANGTAAGPLARSRNAPATAPSMVPQTAYQLGSERSFAVRTSWRSAGFVWWSPLSSHSQTRRERLAPSLVCVWARCWARPGGSNSVDQTKQSR